MTKELRTLESINELLAGQAVVEESEKGYTVTLANGIKWFNVSRLELVPRGDGTAELRPTWFFVPSWATKRKSK